MVRLMDVCLENKTGKKSVMKICNTNSTL